MNWTGARGIWRGSRRQSRGPTEPGRAGTSRPVPRGPTSHFGFDLNRRRGLSHAGGDPRANSSYLRSRRRSTSIPERARELVLLPACGRAAPHRNLPRLCEVARRLRPGERVRVRRPRLDLLHPRDVRPLLSGLRRLVAVLQRRGRHDLRDGGRSRRRACLPTEGRHDPHSEGTGAQALHDGSDDAPHRGGAPRGAAARFRRRARGRVRATGAIVRRSRRPGPVPAASVRRDPPRAGYRGETVEARR